jgi:hypothetical protein
LISARVFLLRAAGIAIIAAALASFALRERWGTGAIGALAWSALSACALGWFGFRSLARAMECKPTQLLAVLAAGLIVRVLVLGASQAVVFIAFGSDWGRRTLVSTVLLYLLVLGVEVLTMNQALRRGDWQRTAREHRESSEGNAGE